MKPGGSVPHSQGFFNSLYPEPNSPNSSYWEWESVVNSFKDSEREVR